MGTNLQLCLPGPQILGSGCSHGDDSNQLGIFLLQPLLEVPPEPGETFMAAFILERICLQSTQHRQGIRGETAHRPRTLGVSTEAEDGDGDAQKEEERPGREEACPSIRCGHVRSLILIQVPGSRRVGVAQGSASASVQGALGPSGLCHGVSWMGVCRARGITALSAPGCWSYDSGSSWPPAGVLVAAATIPYQEGWNSGHLCTTPGPLQALGPEGMSQMQGRSQRGCGCGPLRARGPSLPGPFFCADHLSPTLSPPPVTATPSRSFGKGQYKNTGENDSWHWFLKNQEGTSF